MTEPIRKRLIVPLRPTQAFDVFTDRFGDWWPVATHSVSATAGNLPRDVTVEKRNGGHIVETQNDGNTTRWGTVTTWEPGHAFGVSWYVGRDLDKATDILITFTPVADGTQVDLTHDGFDRLTETAMASRANYCHGWGLVLGKCFAKACRTKVFA